MENSNLKLKAQSVIHASEALEKNTNNDAPSEDEDVSILDYIEDGRVPEDMNPSIQTAMGLADHKVVYITCRVSLLLFTGHTVLSN